MRLYLDVDGCVCPLVAPDPAWGETESSSTFVDYRGGPGTIYDFVWAPALIRALDAVCASYDVELVWLTTWNNFESAWKHLEPHFGGLRHGRVIPPNRQPFFSGEENQRGKAARIIEDQTTNPGPFIWVDDQEIETNCAAVEAATAGKPRLLMPVTSSTGIRAEDIRKICQWLEAGIDRHDLPRSRG